MNTRDPRDCGLGRLRVNTRVKRAFFTESECIPESSHSVIG